MNADETTGAEILATADASGYRTPSFLAGPAGPARQGLYDSRFEHDACGVGFVADLTGRRSHNTVARSLTVLRNLDHRGAKGSDPDTGDGAGIITQIPDGFLRSVCGLELPGRGAYAVGMAFLPDEPEAAAAAVRAVELIAGQEGLRVLGWRAVPHDPAACGHGARAVLPTLSQLFVAGTQGQRGLDLDRSRSACASGPSTRPAATSP